MNFGAAYVLNTFITYLVMLAAHGGYVAWGRKGWSIGNLMIVSALWPVFWVGYFVHRTNYKMFVEWCLLFRTYEQRHTIKAAFATLILSIATIAVNWAHGTYLEDSPEGV